MKNFVFVVQSVYHWQALNNLIEQSAIGYTRVKAIVGTWEGLSILRMPKLLPLSSKVITRDYLNIICPKTPKHIGASMFPQPYMVRGSLSQE
jgi:hypothetical protein